MKILPILVTVLLLLGATALPCLAHRVNIHAWPEGGSVQVRCSFNRGAPVKNGRISVYDATDGAELLTGLTDPQGHFSFPVPDRGRKNGLRIHINAGAGHENQWILQGQELDATSTLSNNITAPTHRVTNAPAQPGDDPKIAQRAVTPQEVRDIVSEIVETKIAPLRQEMAVLTNPEPGLKEITGGLGWIIGLAGIVLYLRSIKKT